MKLIVEVERRSYPKFLDALPAGSKATEQGTSPQRVVLEVETEVTDFPWDKVPGILVIKPFS